MTRAQRRGAGRGGFTLVETLATLALLCFIVVVLGPMMVRVSRQSSTVTTSQYRTAVMVAASSWAMTAPVDQVLAGAGCTPGTAPVFAHAVCLTVTDTLPSLRRVRIVVTPYDSLLSGPDTVTVYRVNTQFANPFNTP